MKVTQYEGELQLDFILFQHTGNNKYIHLSNGLMSTYVRFRFRLSITFFFTMFITASLLLQPSVLLRYADAVESSPQLLCSNGSKPNKDLQCSDGLPPGLLLCKNGSTPDANYQCSDGEHLGLFYCSDKSVPSKKISPKQTTPILVCADGTLAKFRSVSTGGQNTGNTPQGTDVTNTGAPQGPPGPGITEIPDGSIQGKKLAPNSVYTHCITQTGNLVQKGQQSPIQPQQPPQQKQQQQNNNQDNNLTPEGQAKITKQNAYVGEKEDSYTPGFIPIAIGNQPGGSSQTPPTCDSKLADNAVINSKIADNAVDSAKIANDAVNSLKIKDGAVTSKDITNEAIDTNKIKDGSIITNDIGDRQVTLSKLGSDVPTLPKVTVVQQKFDVLSYFQGVKTLTVKCPEDKVVTGGGYVMDHVFFISVRDSYPDIDIGGIGGWSVNVNSNIINLNFAESEIADIEKDKRSVIVYAVCLGITPQPIGEIPVIK